MRECPDCGERWPSDEVECPDDGAPLSPHGKGSTLVGRFIGSYRVTRRIGRGGMGAVFEAEHPAIGSRVAVKLLHRRYSADRAIVERFFNEARAVNVIGHDNIVDIVDFNRLEDGRPYLVMEFLDGKPLSGLADAPQPLAVTGPLFLQVADALQAAHEKGIVHRDLKPDNIFLVTRNRRSHFVKIVDFGIAKLRGNTSGAGRTQTGMVMGTAQYMSPEQAAGEVNRIGPQSDVYSLGVLMFRLATGRLPFDGESFGEILVGHISRPPPSPRLLHPDVPAEYETLILSCLEKRPEDRFSSMEELYSRLDLLLDKLGLPREPPLVRSDRRGASNRRPCFGSGETRPDDRHFGRIVSPQTPLPFHPLSTTSSSLSKDDAPSTIEDSHFRGSGPHAHFSEDDTEGSDAVLGFRQERSPLPSATVPLGNRGPGDEPDPDARAPDPFDDLELRAVEEDEPLFAFDSAAPPSHIEALLGARRRGDHLPGSGVPGLHRHRGEDNREKPDQRSLPKRRSRPNSTLLLGEDDEEEDVRIEADQPGGFGQSFNDGDKTDPGRLEDVGGRSAPSVRTNAAGLGDPDSSPSPHPFPSLPNTNPPPSSSKRRRARRTSGWALPLIALTAVIAVAVGVVLTLQHHRQRMADRVADDEESLSDSITAASSTAARASIRVSSDPTGAQLSVEQDGEKHEFTTPASIRLRPDVTATLTLSSEGYSPVKRPVVPRNGLELHWVLSRLPNARRDGNPRHPTRPSKKGTASRVPSSPTTSPSSEATTATTRSSPSIRAADTSAAAAPGREKGAATPQGIAGPTGDSEATEGSKQDPEEIGDGLVEVDL